MADAIPVTLTSDDPSVAINLRSKTITEIEGPGEWTTGGILFLASFTEGGTFRPLYDAFGDRIEVAMGAERNVVVDPRLFQGVRWIKLVSSVQQAAPRTLVLLVPRLTEIAYAGGGVQAKPA